MQNNLFTLDNQLCFEVYKASNQFTKVYRKVLSKYDLTYTQYIVLLALWEEDKVLVKQLSEKVELGIGTLNPILTKLSEKGWVTKQTALSDHRAVIISLTAKAKEMESIITNDIATKVADCSALTDIYEDLRTQVKQLNGLLKQMNETEDSP